MTENASNLELTQRRLKNQPSTLQIRKQQAVCVRRACKQYGTKKNPFVVLDGLNMTVPKGSIYGLLGASGCGKTTLLSCIVGRRRLDNGEIWVLGGTPGSKGSGVPGPRIGYMPQEVSLYDEFTIQETLQFFGWIAGMNKQQIKDRTTFLINLLMLPDSKQFVKTLSGGQKRRVSLASALIHEPELLILDEPTVGVDPLLRQNIWNHLVEITKEENTTVIITTHYIDETRQAHLIGLMRGGYFLAEESPRTLLQQFRTDTLEDVFLKLSVIQNIGRRRRSSIAAEVTNRVNVPGGVINESAIIDDIDSDEIHEVSGEFGDNISLSSRSGKRLSIAISDAVEVSKISEISPEGNTPSSISNNFTILQGHHMRALIWKNGLWMIRNIPVMLFILGLPVVQILLFCLSIGHDPINLTVAVVNHETNNELKCKSLLTCNSTKLSCTYLQYLEDRAFKLAYYDTEESATNSVLAGKSYASIVIKHNYSMALRSRINNWAHPSPWSIEHSEVEVLRDTSSKDIATYLQVYLYDTFKTFIEDYLESCKYNRHAVSIPIQWKTPVYGLAYPNFTDFATPGLILTVIFFLAVALTSGAMLIERNEGSLERSLVIGISGFEFLLSHVITQFTVMMAQTIMVIVCVFFLFNMTLKGSLGLVVALTLLTGFCGMCFGFVISSICDSERTATYMAMGSFFPMITLCGIIWPIEAMHNLLQMFSFFLPLTRATESMRSILQRGWGFSNKVVYVGFISVGIWIMVFLTISILCMKFKKG